MNTAFTSGRLSKDPEIRYTPKGTGVSEFQLAVDTGYGDSKKTSWISHVVWGKLAEFVVENARKGDELVCKGEIETGSYEGSDGKKVYTTKINVAEVRLVKSVKRDSEEDERPEPAKSSQKKPASGKSARDVDPLADDEED